MEVCQVFLPPAAWHTLCRGQKDRHSLSFCTCPSEKKKRGQIKLSKMELFCHQHTFSLIPVAASSMFLILHLLHLQFQRKVSNVCVMDCIMCVSWHQWWTDAKKESDMKIAEWQPRVTTLGTRSTQWFFSRLFLWEESGLVNHLKTLKRFARPLS